MLDRFCVKHTSCKQGNAEQSKAEVIMKVLNTENLVDNDQPALDEYVPLHLT